MLKFVTENYKETQELGKTFAKEILRCSESFKINKKNSAVKSPRSWRFYRLNKKRSSGAVVLSLYGDLGSGKTTFLQGFAKGLGIKEKILSPTFVIYRKFFISNKPSAIRKTDDRRFRAKRCFYHVDAYRLKNEKDAKELGLPEILKNPENIVAIEWPERIRKILPKNAIKISFKFVSQNQRAIDISTPWG
jgi:tRNA threonylcarbamoyladenosine biosynthesis protein TsaE